MISRIMMFRRDAILYQTSDKKLQRKILSEDLALEETIKMGLELDQSQKKFRD